DGSSWKEMPMNRPYNFGEQIILLRKSSSKSLEISFVADGHVYTYNGKALSVKTSSIFDAKILSTNQQGLNQSYLTHDKLYLVYDSADFPCFEFDESGALVSISDDSSHTLQVFANNRFTGAGNPDSVSSIYANGYNQDWFEIGMYMTYINDSGFSEKCSMPADGYKLLENLIIKKYENGGSYRDMKEVTGENQATDDGYIYFNKTANALEKGIVYNYTAQSLQGLQVYYNGEVSGDTAFIKYYLQGGESLKNTAFAACFISGDELNQYNSCSNHVEVPYQFIEPLQHNESDVQQGIQFGHQKLDHPEDDDIQPYYGMDWMGDDDIDRTNDISVNFYKYIGHNIPNAIKLHSLMFYKLRHSNPINEHYGVTTSGSGDSHYDMATIFLQLDRDSGIPGETGFNNLFLIDEHPFIDSESRSHEFPVIVSHYQMWKDQNSNHDSLTTYDHVENKDRGYPNGPSFRGYNYSVDNDNGMGYSRLLYMRYVDIYGNEGLVLVPAYFGDIGHDGFTIYPHTAWDLGAPLHPSVHI
ncbi:hypothetical protein, partial [Cysteiniphilum marinum]